MSFIAVEVTYGNSVLTVLFAGATITNRRVGTSHMNKLLTGAETRCGVEFTSFLTWPLVLPV